MTTAEHLSALFSADRKLREAEALLLAQPQDQIVALLGPSVAAAAALTDRGEAVMRLERLADLCAQVPGPEMVDALLQILDSDESSVRVAAGEALLDVAYERYAEVARAVERALERGAEGLGMTELPFVIAEVGEPSALGLIAGFMKHASATVVAAAIEAATVLGDPEALPLISELRGDTRSVPNEDEPSLSATVGELAEEALQILGLED